MSSIVVSGDTSGAVTLAVPAVSGTNTVTIAAQTGTLNAAGPAFYAYRGSSDQSFSSNTFTKIQYNTEIFDTANCFDSTTNYRFTPTVAGYYQINIAMYINAAAITRMLLAVYKNGSAYIRPADINAAGNTVSGSVLVYMNGSTDYIEGYAYVTATTPAITSSSELTYFQGFLARGA